MNIKGSLFDGAWYTAYRKSACPLLEKTDVKTPFIVLRNSLRYWCADPFLFWRENTLYIFMELYDVFRQKGVIGYRIMQNGRLSGLHVCLETPYHLSYPYIFEKDGQIYMLPESYQSGKLTLYKAAPFPDHWEPCEDFLQDKAVCDTDYIWNENEEFLLTTPVGGEKFTYDRLEMYRKENGTWQPYCGNPVVQDASRARNAGMPFAYKDRKYRPAQNCSDIYGENLVFHEILQMDEAGYAEKTAFEAAVSDIFIAGSKRKFTGIHTYNRVQEYEVIDLYCSSVFQPVRFLRLLLQKFVRFKG
ncbi:MAG: hypothetical protein IKY52_08180 [Clostridia bacterium]|nr:hypothetical protein [Clostridia bacterium]